jgi:DNA-directed RNA polymerase subunit RPC12/RpoP
MIDTVLNLLFRCSHRRLTRPVAPITKAGQPHSQSYVVCLDCGKQFEYDLKEMRIGKAIDHSHDGGVVPPNLPSPRESKIKYALLAAVPAAVVLGAVLKSKKTVPKPADAKPDPGAHPDAHKETDRTEE